MNRMLKRCLIILSVMIAMVFSFNGCSKTSEGNFDILITNGKIVDGTGNPWFHGDIGIKGDTIADIGDLTGKNATITIDAKGLVVSPGFIDMHTHCDGGLGTLDASANLNYLIQGTTTVVTGNCGGGTFKVAEIKEKWENQGIGTNAVHMVGFGTVREEVMGVEPRAPTPEELEKMKVIVKQAMQEGAWGMSTGLEYIPDTYSTTEEIIAVTKAVSEYNGVYLSHQRDEVARVPEAIRETIRIGEEAGVRVDISHFKICGKRNWGMMEEAVDVINEARNRGINITADMYPYANAATGPLISIARNSGWSIFRLPSDMEPFAELRKKMRAQNLQDSEREKLREQYVNELAKALSDETKREQIRKSVLIGVPHNPSPIAVSGWDSYRILAAKKNTHLIGKIFSDIAEEQKRDPFDLAAELVIEEPDLHLSCGALSEEDMKKAMKYDWLMFSSDGGASAIITEAEKPRYGHPRSFGSQAKVLRKYVREEKVLTLENAIRKMTSLPASFLQLKDRGILIKGHKADIAIFDPETIQDHATYADARKYSSGTDYVIVNGKISVENGEYKGALNGKLLLLTENK